MLFAVQCLVEKDIKRKKAKYNIFIFRDLKMGFPHKIKKEKKGSKKSILKYSHAFRPKSMKNVSNKMIRKHINGKLNNKI